jgi:hypothetical protein
MTDWNKAVSTVDMINAAKLNHFVVQVVVEAVEFTPDNSVTAKTIRTVREITRLSQTEKTLNRAIDIATTYLEILKTDEP